MKYRHHNLEYEISDAWLLEAGVSSFVAETDSYRSLPSEYGDPFIVQINSVEPLEERAKMRGIFCDDKETGASARTRVIRILRWLHDANGVEPVKVAKSNVEGYEYKLIEGCHRFHCALAMGFKSVPAVWGFDMSDPYA